MTKCGKPTKNGKVCTRWIYHDGGHKNEYCPACGTNPQVIRRRSRDRRCNSCRTGHSRYRDFGVSPEQVKNMVTRQAGVCPWCNKPLGEKFAVDHNHDTREVRCLLHIACNGIAGTVEWWLKQSEREQARMRKVFEVQYPL